MKFRRGPAKTGPCLFLRFLAANYELPRATNYRIVQPVRRAPWGRCSAEGETPPLNQELRCGMEVLLRRRQAPTTMRLFWEDKAMRKRVLTTRALVARGLTAGLFAAFVLFGLSASPAWS